MGVQRKGDVGRVHTPAGEEGTQPGSPQELQRAPEDRGGLRMIDILTEGDPSGSSEPIRDRGISKDKTRKIQIVLGTTASGGTKHARREWGAVVRMRIENE